MTYRATDDNKSQVWATSPYAETGGNLGFYDSTSRSRLYGSGLIESDFSIPRPNVYQERQRKEIIKETYTNEAETYNEIIERISDEFRFLEERRAVSQKADPPNRFSSRFPISYRQYLFGSIAILQIIVAIGMFIFAILRYIRLISSNANSNMLFDFVKAEDFVETNQEGAEIISMKFGSGLFIPTILQIISGCTVLALVYKGPSSDYLLVLSILVSIFSIAFWVEPLTLVIFELNLQHIQLRSDTTNFGDFHLLIVLITLLSVDVLLLTTILLVYASTLFVSLHRTRSNSIMDLHINIIHLIIAAISLILSVYALANSMSDVTKWRNTARNMPALFGIGLREAIISCYIFFGSLYSTAISSLHIHSLRFSTFFIQGLSLYILMSNLLNSDRITAVTHNVRVMLNVGATEPFTGEILLFLYIFIVLLAISLLVQLFVTVVNVFKDVGDTFELSRRRLSYPNKIEYQRSAL